MHRKRRRRLCRAAACRASSVRPHLKPPRYWQWTSDRDLREMGSSYGTIVKVQFKEERRTGKSLGCATSPSAAGNQLARLSRTQRITLCASVLPAAELPWSPSKLSAPRGTPKSTSSPGSAWRFPIPSPPFSCSRLTRQHRREFGVGKALKVTLSNGKDAAAMAVLGHASASVVARRSLLYRAGQETGD